MTEDEKFKKKFMVLKFCKVCTTRKHVKFEDLLEWIFLKIMAKILRIPQTSSKDTMKRKNLLLL